MGSRFPWYCPDPPARALPGDAGTVRLPPGRSGTRSASSCVYPPLATRCSPHDLAGHPGQGVHRRAVRTARRNSAAGRKLGSIKRSITRIFERVVYVTAETLGRTPRNAPRRRRSTLVGPRTARPHRMRRSGPVLGGGGWVARTKPRPISERTFVHNGGGVAWAAPGGDSRRVLRRGRMEDHARRLP